MNSYVIFENCTVTSFFFLAVVHLLQSHYSAHCRDTCCNSKCQLVVPVHGRIPCLLMQNRRWIMWEQWASLGCSFFLLYALWDDALMVHWKNNSQGCWKGSSIMQCHSVLVVQKELVCWGVAHTHRRRWLSCPGGLSNTMGSLVG